MLLYGHVTTKIKHMAHLGKNQKHLLDFANKYPQHWHTYKHKCAATKSAVNSLAEMGIIEMMGIKGIGPKKISTIW